MKLLNSSTSFWFIIVFVLVDPKSWWLWAKWLKCIILGLTYYCSYSTPNIGPFLENTSHYLPWLGNRDIPNFEFGFVKLLMFWCISGSYSPKSANLNLKRKNFILPCNWLKFDDIFNWNYIGFGFGKSCWFGFSRGSEHVYNIGMLQNW